MDILFALYIYSLQITPKNCNIYTNQPTTFEHSKRLQKYGGRKYGGKWISNIVNFRNSEPGIKERES